MVTFKDNQQNQKLHEFRLKEEEDLVQILAKTRYDLPYIDLNQVFIENAALEVVPEKEALNAAVGPFHIKGKSVDLAVRSPISDETSELVKNLEKKGYSPNLFMASGRSIDKVHARYAEISLSKRSDRGSLDIHNESLESLQKKTKTLKTARETLEEIISGGGSSTVSSLLEAVLAASIGLGASDIHIEPEEDEIKLRFRIDGVLQGLASFPSKMFKLLSSRIKLLSGMKITTLNKNQDGRFSILISEEEINIRASAIPGAYGESIVLRLLDPRNINVGMESLGMNPHLLAVVEKEISKPNGLIILTGPTGSGKTTSLYSFLQKIYSTEKKIITIEDPIEYHLDGITQTQVDKKKGYTFLEGLRSALRQDPDVLMVGEIRDSETAKIAIESSLTGHIVFSTLHTNNAAGAIPRLIDLGVNAKTIPSSLSLAIAQRLIRVLYPETKKSHAPTDDEHKKILNILEFGIKQGKDFSKHGIDIELIKNKEYVLYKPVPSEMSPTGYKGRLGVFEAVAADEEIEKIIPSNPSEREIRTVAAKQGFITMQEDGVIKILKGITSLEEVERSVDLSEAY
ncbi:MAG: type IV pilus assembly protein PilB [Candidatus Paceibacteria bacterium]|jgi:type IV pilus assembly protein PilB